MIQLSNRRIEFYCIVLLNVLLFNLVLKGLLEGSISWWAVIVLNLVHTLSLWFSIKQVYKKIKNSFQLFKQTNIAIFYTILAVVVLAFFVSILKLQLFKLLVPGSAPNVFDYIFSVSFNIVIGLVIASIFFLQHYLTEWKKVYRQAEELKQQNLSSQLELLKTQVKPHFLFNSLNSLAGLIEEDHHKATRFVEELSFVYRYLLQNNEKQLNTLYDELNFINAYFFLLKSRFEEGIELNAEIPSSFYTYCIPPLTLQLLIENAVKHNTLSKSEPLLIEIKIDGDKLVVRNNLQRKTSRVPSTKMGLVNIMSKYKLVNGSEVHITETNRHFTVILPLIKPV